VKPLFSLLWHSVAFFRPHCMAYRVIITKFAVQFTLDDGKRFNHYLKQLITNY